MKARVVLGSLSVTLLLMSCGGSSGGNANISSLSQIPSTTSMISTSDATTGLTLASVSGDAPLLKDLNDTSAKTYFWGTLIDDINASSVDPTSEAIRSRFFGGSIGNEGGEGACRMAQSVGFSFEPVIQSGTSFCYMKNMPTVASGVTITPSLDTPSTLFDQQSEDRVVRVNVQGGGGGGGDDEGGSETVYIKVFGSSNSDVGSEKYKVHLWFCSEAGSLRGAEELEVDRTSGLFTSVSKHTDHGNSKAEITAYLKKDGDSLVFDTSKDRVASIHHSYTHGSDSGLFKGLITVTSDNLIKAKTFNQHTHGAFTGTDKNYSVSEFSGTGISSLKFLQAAFKGSGSGGEQNFSYSGETEFQSTMYKAVSGGELASHLTSVDLATDSFFSSLGSPNVDLSGYSCDVSDISYTVEMDFGDSNVAAIKTSCEADRLENMNFCNSSSIEQARRALWGI